MFSSGHPDGNVAWSVLGPNGVQMDSGSITPDANAVSVNIPLSTVVNTLGVGSMMSFRDVVWTYSVLGVVINDELRYSVQARVPLGASPDGVRQLLGVSRVELPDDDIPLVEAYIRFIDIVSQESFDAAIDGGIADLTLRRAIEASAALAVLPTMPIRVTNQESSGTNSFKRQEIDWAAIGDNLAGLINGAIILVDPTFDITAGFGALLILASPSVDPITGASASG
jgi:hypothetical protein